MATSLLFGCFASASLDADVNDAGEAPEVHQDNFLLAQGRVIEERAIREPEVPLGSHAVPDPSIGTFGGVGATPTGFIAYWAPRGGPNDVTVNLFSGFGWIAGWGEPTEVSPLGANGTVAYHPHVTFLTTNRTTWEVTRSGLIHTTLPGNVSIGADGRLYIPGQYLNRAPDPRAPQAMVDVIENVSSLPETFPILAAADGTLTYFRSDAEAQRWERYTSNGTPLSVHEDIPHPSRPPSLGPGGRVLWIDESDSRAVYIAPTTLESYRVLLHLEADWCPCLVAFASPAFQ